jgi:hypothetical protein
VQRVQLVLLAMQSSMVASRSEVQLQELAAVILNVLQAAHSYQVGRRLPCCSLPCCRPPAASRAVGTRLDARCLGAQASTLACLDPQCPQKAHLALALPTLNLHHTHACRPRT